MGFATKALHHDRVRARNILKYTSVTKLGEGVGRGWGGGGVGRLVMLKCLELSSTEQNV